MEVAIIRGSTKETRAAILKSAMEVFLEVGYQEASMRKIAARAGITNRRRNIQAFLRQRGNV